MSELSTDTTALGPEPRWYVYLAVIVLAGGLSAAIHIGVEAAADRWPQIRTLIAGYLGTVSALLSGLTWGVVLRWAVRVRLAIVVPVILIVPILGMVSLYQSMAEFGLLRPEFSEARAVLIRVVLRELAVFWVALFAVAIPPRRQLHRQA